MKRPWQWGAKDWLPHEIERARHTWTVHSECSRDIDKMVGPLLNIKFYSPWLKRMRVARQISQSTLANRLKISQQAYATFERSEEAGEITLRNIRRAAEALDCDFVYALIPRSKQLPSQTIWKEILPDMQRHKWVLLWSLANEAYGDAKYRRAKGWTPRREEKPCGVRAARPKVSGLKKRPF